MKFQNPSLNSVLTGQTDERTSRNQYAPHFFKVGGIKSGDTGFPIITLSWKPVFGSSRISNSSKLSCMLSLPASMKRIRLRTAEKKWRHHFSHYKPMGIFSDFQGQLTPQSVVQSSRNSNLSKLSFMSLLPASMKRNG